MWFLFFFMFIFLSFFLSFVVVVVVVVVVDSFTYRSRCRCDVCRGRYCWRHSLGDAPRQPARKSVFDEHGTPRWVSKERVRGGPFFRNQVTGPLFTGLRKLTLVGDGIAIRCYKAAPRTANLQRKHMLIILLKRHWN